MRNVLSRGSHRHAVRAVAVGVAACAAVTVATPAEALLLLPSAGNCGAWGEQRCYGNGQSVPVGTASLTVTFECTAVTPFTVNSTGVGCFLRGDDGRDYAHTGPHFTSGQQSTVQRVATSVKFQGYRICVGAGYLTTGGYFQPVGGYNCNVMPVAGS